MRQRIKENMICSSENYLQTSRAYKNRIKRSHQEFEETRPKRPYIKAFGSFMLVSLNKVEQLSKTETIYWR